MTVQFRSSGPVGIANPTTGVGPAIADSSANRLQEFIDATFAAVKAARLPTPTDIADGKNMCDKFTLSVKRDPIPA